MTSGLPPGAAVRLRAGAFGRPAVASVLSLPVWLVFVGTVLLSVVLRRRRVEPVVVDRPSLRAMDAASGSRSRRPAPDAPHALGRRRGNAPRRATVSHSRRNRPGATHRGRAVTGPNAGRAPLFPGAPGRPVPGQSAV